MEAAGTTIALLGMLALAIGIVWFFVNLVRRRPLRRPVMVSAIAAVAMVAAAAVAGTAKSSREAAERGFADADEMRAAITAGFDAPEPYRTHLATVAAEEAAKAEEQRKAEEAAAAAKRAEEEKAEEERRQAELAAAAEAAAQLAAEEKAKEASCRADLGCWGEKHFVRASFACAKVVPRLAQYTHRWTDGTFEPKFSHYRWTDQPAGIVTYIGDKVEFQNGFGAWSPMTYFCEFDPRSETVLNATATPGRLPE